jgi:multidrug resistance efflux pump
MSVLKTGVALCVLVAEVAAAQSSSIRLHGTVEPVRSYTVSAPRLTGGAPGTSVGPLIVVHLARPGVYVQPGGLLVEFDRQTQIKAVRDREAEHRDIVEQINKKRGEQLTARALRDSQLKQAENQVKIAELGVVGNDLLPTITAEKNLQLLEEAKAIVVQLRKTFDLKARAEAADLRILEIQRDRARNALSHATRNADRMKITAPLAGLVVLKSIWKSGTMAEVQEGEEVRPGTPILEIVDPSAMRVRANVNQADVEHLVPGMPARITLDSYTGKRFNARLEQLSPVAMTSALSNRVRTFVATFAVEGADEHFLPDLAAAIEVTPRAPANAGAKQ